MADVSQEPQRYLIVLPEREFAIGETFAKKHLTHVRQVHIPEPCPLCGVIDCGAHKQGADDGKANQTCENHSEDHRCFSD